ncbi:uncharacterized protein [Euphorbia lathyris]|uniref:uncharacterized protein n=1 Tax=Euphorbia lathyris TaxID=212925 RepID=UPI00331377E7
MAKKHVRHGSLDQWVLFNGPNPIKLGSEIAKFQRPRFIFRISVSDPLSPNSSRPAAPLHQRWNLSQPEEDQDLEGRWKALDFATLKRSSVSFFNIQRHETTASKWARATTRAAKVGCR